MCLIHFHHLEHAHYKLILAANRDEFYQRPTEQAHFWPDAPYLLAGRDGLKNGTWLGVTKEGRVGALTNIRDFSMDENDKKSRGAIVRDYLSSQEPPEVFLEKLSKEKDEYAGFNILVGGADDLYHYNNQLDEITRVTPGTHSLSNASLNTPWPKVVRGKKMLADYVASSESVKTDDLFSILEREEEAADSALPETGIGLEMERKLSASFIRTPEYGTRSSTVLLVDKEYNLTFKERTYENGNFKKEAAFEFAIPLAARK